MREYEFRGKRLDDGEWVYGYYIRYEHMGIVKHIIVTNWAQVYVNSFQVDPETVGQYTGLNDSRRTKEYPKGKEIYEGSILSWGPEDHTPNSEVFFDDGAFKVTDPASDTWELLIDVLNGAEVVGNIHDNPELLEEG